MEPDDRRVKRRSERSEAARALASALEGGRAGAGADMRELQRPPRERGASVPERSAVARDGLLRAYSGRAELRSPRDGGRPRPEARDAAVSATSAAAVSMATRRSAARSPRDMNVLVDKLLASVHGAPSAITTRRAVVRLHDSVGQHSIDSLSVLEKIKRKMSTDSPLYYDNPNEAATQLNELYSRFVRYRNVDKKPEALMLLYGLMDSAPAPIFSARTAAPREDPAPFSRDRFRLSSDAYLTNNEASRAVHHVTQQEKSVNAGDSLRGDSAVPVSKPLTSLDSLEDSFKFAVGIASAPKSKIKSHRKEAATIARSFRAAAELTHTSRDIKEQVLLRDVLFALQAIESRNIYFDKIADGFQLSEDDHIPSPMRKLILKLCELGWFYRKISTYINSHRQDLALGVVGQSFCHVLNTELADYFRLIAVLAAQVDDDASSREGNDGSLSVLTLRNLLVWTQDPLDRMRLMARLIDSVNGLRGGALASGIHSHLLHGDPSVAQFVGSVLKRVASPIFRMIRRWVFEGELEDNHAEFFVEADPNVSNNELWAKKYTLNVKMLPTFIPVELAKKILIVGKSINFIRQCCGNANWVLKTEHDKLIPSLHKQDEDGDHFAELIQLEAMIELAANSTNEYLIRSLMEKYSLLEHLRALKRFLLLGQGDFIQYLMDLLGPELSKRGVSVYRHTLTNVLETALNASNAKFESQEVLKRLDVELLEPSSADSGWDIFCLHYRLDAPINSVINDDTILEYQKIFDFLWRLKRVEFSLSGSWSKDMNLGHMIQGRIPGFRAVIHRCQLLRSEMIHFTANLHNYMMFEVLETAWHTLVKSVNAAKDLDEVIESHRVYIASIRQNGFMTRDSREVMKQLKLIFGIIIKFCKTQEHLYTLSLREVHEAKQRQQVTDRRTDEGTWGTSDRDEYERMEAPTAFNPTSKLSFQINEIAEEFSQRFVELLDMVKERPTGGPQSLPFLVSRFDFNEYYRKKMTPMTDNDE